VQEALRTLPVQNGASRRGKWGLAPWKRYGRDCLYL